MVYKERSSVNFEKSFRRDNMFSIISQECKKTCRIQRYVTLLKDRERLPLSSVSDATVIVPFQIWCIVEDVRNRDLVDENHLVSGRVIEGEHVFYRAEIIAHFHLDIKFLLKLSNERIS
ncbi:hypothetical protein BRC91_12255, partial [Halobacteriales archaeon QS_4_62_28]